MPFLSPAATAGTSELLSPSSLARPASTSVAASRGHRRRPGRSPSRSSASCPPCFCAENSTRGYLDRGMAPGRTRATLRIMTKALDGKVALVTGGSARDRGRDRQATGPRRRGRGDHLLQFTPEGGGRGARDRGGGRRLLSPSGPTCPDADAVRGAVRETVPARPHRRARQQRGRRHREAVLRPRVDDFDVCWPSTSAASSSPRRKPPGT